MLFRIWDASDALEYAVTSVTYKVGDGIFFADSIHVVTTMTIEKP